MGGALIYAVELGIWFGVAMGLFFVLRSIKLI